MPAEPCRILIVDDHPDTAESLALLCQLDGHETQSVTRGDEALEVARDFRPDILVVDLVLRGSKIDGFELARLVREDAALGDVSLVASTGLTRPSDRMRAQHLGFDHYFVKPADPDQLLKLIDEVLCRRRGRRPAVKQTLQ